MISCVLYASVKVTAFLWAEKMSSEYWNNRILLISMKTQFGLWFFQVARSSLTIFYCFNIHALTSPRTGAIWDKLYHVRKSMIGCVLCTSVKVTALLWAEKIPSEYWNNRILLMSLKTQISSWIFQVARSSLTIFYCFNIHALISPRTGGIPRRI